MQLQVFVACGIWFFPFAVMIPRPNNILGFGIMKSQFTPVDILLHFIIERSAHFVIHQIAYPIRLFPFATDVYLSKYFHSSLPCVFRLSTFDFRLMSAFACLSS